LVFDATYKPFSNFSSLLGCYDLNIAIVISLNQLTKDHFGNDKIQMSNSTNQYQSPNNKYVQINGLKF